MRSHILPYVFAVACLSGALLRAQEALPLVPPADLSRLKLADFADDELNLPYHLAHFHTVANSIESQGLERGYIRLNVWRGGTVAPFNARVMENILSLAYWFCLDRPWNPYRGHPAVRARLEAALDFWCRSQNTDGRFSEYAAQRWGLAPTAFATKFMGEALILLKDGPPIDAAMHARAVEANRRAIHATLTHPDLYQHGKSYTNQFGNVWGGGLAHLSVYPDPQLRVLWEKRFRDSRDDFQSPAGYYYERDGPDFGYTTSTHDHNTRQAWPWLRGTPLGQELLAKEQKWFEWLAVNVVPEPDGSGFVYNRAIETRQRHTSFKYYDTPLGEFIPLVRAFAEAPAERNARLGAQRAALAARWPVVAPLPVGEFWAYSPYEFLHRRLKEWHPTQEEREEARRRLPMIEADLFVRQFADSRKAVVFTFVRRPAYYAAFNAGEIIHDQQRYGLGLVWTPQLGAVIQSQTASDTAAWGTKAADAKSVYESTTLPVQFMIGSGVMGSATPGVRDLPAGDLGVRYPLGKRGEKTGTFLPDRIKVGIVHPGDFSEVLPLLVPRGGRVEVSADRATIRSSGGDFLIRFGPGARAATTDTSVTVLTKRLVVLTLSAREKLDYELGGN